MTTVKFWWNIFTYMARAKINALSDTKVNRKLSRLMEIMRTEELEEVLVTPWLPCPASLRR